MEIINVVFDGDYEDVDIILVPESIVDEIEIYLQSFFDWATDTPNRKKYEVTDQFGRIVVSLGTVEFVNWLNQCILAPPEQAGILEQHTTFLANKPVIEF